MFIRHLRLAAPLALTAAITSAAVTNTASAADFSAVYSILTGLHDVADFTYANARYKAFFQKYADDGDLYINSTGFSPGVDWDQRIAVTTASSELRHDSGTYTFGTPITGEVAWQFDDVANVYGAVDAEVAPGVYNFSIDFFGGDNLGASDLIASIPYQIEVIPSLEFTISASTTPASIAPGQSVDVSVTLTNDMPDRDLLTTLWFTYVPGFAGPDGASLELDKFLGNWFSQPILPGQSRTDLHTRFDSRPGLPGGTYTGNMGVYGGLHQGDEFEFVVHPTLEITGGPAIPGDADYSGYIDADDYALLDRGLVAGRNGWSNGDFNGDGVIDELDYLLIDQSLAAQSGSSFSPDFLTARAAQFGPGYVQSLLAAVPEPASLTPLLLAALSLRRRRHGHA